MGITINQLPHLNAILNGLASLLLLAGFFQIRRRNERAHSALMLAAFVTSIAFLISYLTYHFEVPSKKFPLTAPVGVRYFYYGLLLSHVVLAITVPFFAVAAIVLGLRQKRSAHRRVVRWGFPIWMYVSVTGVVVYVMLYQLYPTGS